jgi:hypothetical protein
MPFMMYKSNARGAIEHLQMHQKVQEYVYFKQSISVQLVCAGLRKRYKYSPYYSDL